MNISPVSNSYKQSFNGAFKLAKVQPVDVKGQEPEAKKVLNVLKKELNNSFAISQTAHDRYIHCLAQDDAKVAAILIKNKLSFDYRTEDNRDYLMHF